MITGDLDLDRALRDPRYRQAALRFLEGPRGEPAAASDPAASAPPCLTSPDSRGDAEARIPEQTPVLRVSVSPRG